MRKGNRHVVGAGAAAIALSTGLRIAQGAAQAPASQARMHIGHVMTSWKDTPGMKGFLPAAMDDARIAEENAHKTDLEGRINDFILYSGYTLNALDPTPENKALIQTAYTRLPTGADPRLKVEIPGTGYGLKQAVAGALQHVQHGAKAPDASENATKQSTPV